MRVVHLMAVLFGTSLVGAAIATWLITTPRPAFAHDAEPALDGQADAAKGKLIFAAGDCASCHASPGQSDRLRLGGGLALASPYGTFRVPNISMDPVDGIGSWRTVDLANALLSGVSPRGSHYYPSFPYSSYVKMKLSDVSDLMAYLRTLPAVAGKAPAHELVLPFQIRRFVGFWKFLYFDREPIVPDPGRGDAWNRGQYLTEALAHCAECHSSRDIFGAIKPKTRFAGGQDPEGVGYIPNITPKRIGDWKQEDIAEVLKTGATPNHGRVGSSMTDVVTNTAMLPQTDRDAIAAYIRSLPSRDTPQP
ncbi:c-type cytochrome [Bradyrhizobium sp. URHC0002]|jgi:mono/diheme cytochrome c family protein